MISKLSEGRIFSNYQLSCFLQMRVSVTTGGMTVVPVADHPVLMLKSTLLFLPTVCIERTCQT